MTLQEKMIWYRAKHRITQGELARRCGVSTQTINSVENGLQNPTKLTETKILLVVEQEEEEE